MQNSYNPGKFGIQEKTEQKCRHYCTGRKAARAQWSTFTVDPTGRRSFCGTPSSVTWYPAAGACSRPIIAARLATEGNGRTPAVTTWAAWTMTTAQPAQHTSLKIISQTGT